MYRDDEYVWAGVEDPKIVVTTSHDPSSRLKQFAKVRVEYGEPMYVCMYVRKNMRSIWELNPDISNSS